MKTITLLSIHNDRTMIPKYSNVYFQRKNELSFDQLLMELMKLLCNKYPLTMVTLN